MNEKKSRCIFCLKTDGPFERREHILPESCSNEEIVLPPGVVCDPCNQYFSQLDGHFAHHHHGVVHKLLHVPQTKKGKRPTMPLEGEGGQAKLVEPGKLSFHQPVLPGREGDFSMTFFANEIVLKATFRPEPADAKLISRFLAKAGLEILYLKDDDQKQMAFETRFDAIRKYARYGSPSSLFVPFAWLRGPWPNTQVLRLSLEWKKNTHLNRMLAHIVVPGAAYAVPLESLDETWPIETVAENLAYSIVAEPKTIDPEPVEIKLQWGDDSKKSVKDEVIVEEGANTELTLQKEAEDKDQ